jgi:AraC-like DNA-binding protein
VAVPCGCRRERVREALVRAARIPVRYDGCTLEGFDTGWAGSDDPSLRLAKSRTQAFVDTWAARPPERGLLFVGRTGCGKTHLAVAALRRLVLEKGVAGLYVNFVEELTPTAEARGLVVRDRLIWQINDMSSVRELVLRLFEALSDVDSFGSVDRIDRLCEGLIVESLISAALPPLGAREGPLKAIRAHLERHYREPIDFDRLALKHRLSPSDFRRKWGAVMHVAPGQFITRLRMREACRLLVETDIPVGQIAAAVGYEDPLHFSRRFHQVTADSSGFGVSE